MKTSRNPFTLPATVVLSGMLLSALAPSAISQTVDTSTGVVGNSSASASTPPPANPTPTRLVARLMPSGPDSRAQGEISFSMAGDSLNVTGRIDGLGPNLRYQLAVPPAVTSVEEKEVPAKEEPATADSRPAPTTENPPPGAGTPAAGEPNAGGPEAGRPEAGKPDGTYRPGAGGAGTQGTRGSGTRASSNADAKQFAIGSAKPSGDLGTLTADPSGGTNVNLTVRSMAFTTGPNSLQGRAVILTRIPTPAAGSETAPVMVAVGLIEISGKPD